MEQNGLAGFKGKAVFGGISGRDQGRGGEVSGTV